MDIYDRTQAAFEIQLRTVDGLPFHPTTGAVLIAPENVTFEPVEGTGWLRGVFAPGPSVRKTAGDTGYSRIDGFYDIDVFWPIGSGTAEPRKLADAIIKHFKSGTILSEGGARITIVAARRETARKDDEWYHIPISVEWYTHHNEV